MGLEIQPLNQCQFSSSPIIQVFIQLQGSVDMFLKFISDSFILFNHYHHYKQKRSLIALRSGQYRFCILTFDFPHCLAFNYFTNQTLYGSRRNPLFRLGWSFHHCLNVLFLFPSHCLVHVKPLFSASEKQQCIQDVREKEECFTPTFQL